MKRDIKDEVNSLLQGKGLEKSRGTGEVKLLRALKLGAQEGVNWLKNNVPQKVYRMIMKDSQDVLRQGNIVKIGLVKEYVTQRSKRGVERRPLSS